jgi:RNA polymerase primary sigma factor
MKASKRSAGLARGADAKNDTQLSPPSSEGNMAQKREAATANLPELDDESEHTSVRMKRASALRSDPPDTRGSYDSGSVAPASDMPEVLEQAEHGTPEVDSTSDSMLSRYFRDMATHQVMGPDEELQAAQSVEEAEVDHWTALLSYLRQRSTC